METFQHDFNRIYNLMRNQTTCRHGSSSHLVFGCIVALWEISINLPIMQQVVVDQVPAPALVVTAQQGHVALALH